MYPAAALAGGLFDQAVQVLASGEPQQVSGGGDQHPGRGTRVTAVLEVRIARLYDGVVIAWRRADERGAARPRCCSTRSGWAGSAAGRRTCSPARCTGPSRTFALFGQPPGDPVPVGQLTAHVPAEDIAAVQGFRGCCSASSGRPPPRSGSSGPTTGASGRSAPSPSRSTDPAGTLIAVRGAYQDVSADYHTQVAFAADPGPAGRHRGAGRGGAPAGGAAAAGHHAPLGRSRSRSAGLDVAARYRPAGPGNLVSGDWYDTVPLPSGEVLLVVGDIAGHGIDAVTGMVALRNCLRGLAITGAGPAALLGWLNGVACHLTDGIIGTAVCGLYDPADRTLRWARAGHLPPRAGPRRRGRELELPQGVLLGADPDATTRR